MSSSSEQVDLVVKTIAQTAVDNETYFGDLDAVVGDGDFGFSLARGFEIVLAEFDSFDRADVGTFLKKIGVTIPAGSEVPRVLSGAPRSCGRGLGSGRDGNHQRR